MKEIHFSLPPLRSTSLGDLTDPNDLDADVECLLLPPVSNQRSNSFSKFKLSILYKVDMMPSNV